jgi:hypothetical protein
MSNLHPTASDPYGDYTDALDAYRVALERLKHAKAAYLASKAKPKPRTYTLAEIDTFTPPSFKIDPYHNE